MGYRTDAVRKTLKLIKVLLKGPYTVREMTEITEIKESSIYRYIVVLGEYLPVQSAMRKIYPRGRQSKVYWLE